MVTAVSYDGKLVIIDEKDLDEFNRRNKKIKQLIKKGCSKQDIAKLLMEGKIWKNFLQFKRKLLQTT